MNTDTEFGIGVRDLEGGGESPAVGEERGAGDEAVAMGVGDASIDPVAPGEVVGVNDQILHSGRTPVRRDSYSFESAATFVPLTAILTNSSMAC